MRSARYQRVDPIRRYPDVRAAIRDALRFLRPPDVLSVSAWADQHRYLDQSSPEPGLWRTSRTPFLEEIMNSLGPHSPVERVVFMKGSQIGGTEALLNVCGYYMENVPSSIMLVSPTREMCERFSRQRLDTMIQHSPRLRALVENPRSRYSGNTRFLKQYRGGVLVLAGANSPSGLRSMPCRLVLLDECDAYPPSASNEGDPITLATMRTVAFGSARKIFIVSTPVLEASSRIAKLYQESDQRKYFVPCPRCGAYQVLRWEQVDLETGEYVCECEGRIRNSEKTGMLARGEWRPTAEGDGRTRGYHLSALYAPLGWPGWSDLVRDYKEAQKSKETLQTFHNTVLGLPWGDAESAPVEADELYARREPFAAEVPAGGVLLTCGVDVQKTRLEAEVVAWGEAEENWSVGYYSLQGDPSQSRVWAELDKLLLKEFRHESGWPLTVAATCVDSGYLSPEVYAFTRDKAHRRVWATKGANNSFQRPIFPRKTNKGAHKGTFFLVGPDAAKEKVYSMLRVPRPGPRFCHFGLDRDRTYFQELTSEHILTSYKRGFPVRQWVRNRDFRNEPLDTRALAICALHGLYAAGIRLDQYVESFVKMIMPHSDAHPAEPEIYRSRYLAE